MFQYRYLREWRKNPHWSLSCCLAWLLPLNDFHGEISGLAEENLFQNQVKTSQIGQPTIFSAVKDSGVIDVTLGKDTQGDDVKKLKKDAIRQDIEDSDRKCHQVTQTKLLSISKIVTMKELQKERL